MRDGGLGADPDADRQRSAKGVEFRVLGPLEALVDGAAVPLGGPKQRAVLGVLLAGGGEPVPAGRLVDELWGESPPATATAALQVHVSGLRKVLPGRIRTVPAGYVLDLAGAAVDTDGVEDALRRARAGEPAETAAGLAAVLARWRGPAYGGVPPSPAVTAAATHWEELRLGALEDRLAADLALGRHAELRAELAGLTAAYPTRERLAAHRMLAAYRSGQPGEALAAYRDLRRALAAELGVEPGERVEALARAIERADPTLAAPTALPIPASRFVGRRRELDRLGELLGRSRVVTVTGPGGAGKTRLALQLAREAGPEHPDGVHLVELAAAASVPGAVATALDVREQPDEPLPATLVAALRARRILVVLDNCEHVLDEAAALAATLLAGCPGLRVLATSREQLGIEGEAVWPLAGLQLPGEDDAPAVAARTDAVRLLADRGALARPGFRLDPADVPVAAALCRRLDGLPLAIELAAAGLAAVLGAGSEDVLARLVDRSMVVAEPGPGATRYRMLETVRDYAAERLAAAGETGLHRAHATWCLGLARRVATFGGADHPAELAALATEYGNVLAALDWAAAADPTLGLEIAAPMWWFWWERGLMGSGLAYLSRALDAAGPAPTAARAGALRAAAALARNNGHFADARRLGEESLAVFRSLGDAEGEAAALNNLLITAHAQSDFTASLAYGRAALVLAEAGGDRRRIAATENNIAATLRNLGRPADAITALTRALALFREIDDRRGEAAAASNLAIAAWQAGDPAGSRRWWATALPLYRALELAEGVVDVIDGVACLLAAEGRAADALRLITVADRERHRLGAPQLGPDEVSGREHALATARRALGRAASGVESGAASEPLDSILDTVHEYL
ncbi:MAG TPA: BTAD domain-containing putative transcriptional regulator [Mycobacteriales bacterium]|nr:BTAD domain-containing putative transcriptional regulator [Mycobacteriales bacterium]